MNKQDLPVKTAQPEVSVEVAAEVLRRRAPGVHEVQRAAAKPRDEIMAGQRRKYIGSR